MKRTILIIALALALLYTSSLWAATPGTCTQAFSEVYSATGPTRLATLTFTCTASVDAATFPSTATSTTITDQIAGRFITQVRTNPGATAPTDDYDIVINDADGIDLMGGTLANRDTANSELAIPALAAGVYGSQPIDGALTLVITGNAVNSAVVVVKVFLER